MSGRIVTASEVVRETLDWGSMAWCCRPTGTGMKNLVVIEVTLEPGGSHAFHKHSGQEEVIYCIEGQVEQWLEQEKQSLGPGDSVVIPINVVHATVNTGSGNAKLLAILGPAVNDENGYALEEMADVEPWNGLM